jgi:tRNA nucleotidyltransferase (CCA-adding enzyme)
MKITIEKLPADVLVLIETARAIAHHRGYHAYLVGGFVRDLILGVKNLDLDIVVDGNGITFAHDYARRLQGTLVTHHRFGTATVSLNNHMKVDIASARKESYPQPAHLPVVAPGTLRDDLYRRDFTINAMALQITGAGNGHLVDFFNGRKDLTRRKLRVLHPVSFIDDPTRILRGIRFEQRYGLAFERYTFKLLKDAVAQSMLSRVEPQRLRDELILLLKEDKPVKMIRRITALTGFSFISPKLHRTARMMRTLSAIERRAAWFRLHSVQHHPLDVWIVYFAGLISSLQPADVRAVCRRFVFRTVEEKKIISCIEAADHAIMELRKKKIKRSEIFHVLKPQSPEVIIMMLARTRSAPVTERIREFLNVSSVTKISVSGHDLNSCGLTPGPHYQRILRTVLNEKLDGTLPDRAAELRRAAQIARAMIKRKEK